MEEIYSDTFNVDRNLAGELAHNIEIYHIPKCYTAKDYTAKELIT